MSVSSLQDSSPFSQFAPKIVNIAAYKFFHWDDFASHRESMRAQCKDLELRGTIMLSGEGINLFLAGSRESIELFLVDLRSIPGLEDLKVKESLTDYQPFNRMLVKLKREIIPVGVDGISPEQDAAPKLSPEQLRQWLDEKKPVAMLDTRNDYEVELGTFENAIDLRIRNFREFPRAAAALPEEVKQNPVVMFCTGGIRCEKIGPYMKGLGFKEIYQLEGGILKYFEECQHAHYEGECFVFDQRVAVDPTLAESDCSECFACKHALTPDDLQSEKYVPSQSCPYCYKTPDELHQIHLAKRQERIQAIAGEQHGSTPYENRRWISIPRRAAGKPLVEALIDFYPGYSQQQWLDAIRDGEIASPVDRDERLSFVPVTPEQVVREGERFMHTLPDYTEPPINPNVGLLYEDEAIVVVCKSAPLPMHPSGRFNRNTLESILNQVYYPEKLRPAHRLDAHTTGLVVFGRKFIHSQFLQNQFNDGMVEKKYAVIVEGNPSWDSMVCQEPIDKEPMANGGRLLSKSGQDAYTEFRVLERSVLGGAFTQLEAKPKTGRTHQIRLHLAFLGHPVWNDPLYLAGGTTRSVADAKRQTLPIGLHASELTFTHPISKKQVTFVTMSSFPS